MRFGDVAEECGSSGARVSEQETRPRGRGDVERGSEQEDERERGG